MTQIDFRALVQENLHRSVLSVFLDRPSTGQADPHVWRLRLDRLASGVRSELAAEAHDDLGRFDAALEHAQAWVASRPRVMPPPGWFIFATEDGVVHAGDLPYPPLARVRWSQGVDGAGYLAGARPFGSIVAAVVDQSRARIFRFRDWDLEEVSDLTWQPDALDTVSDGARKSASMTTGQRGATRRDQAQRTLTRQRDQFISEVSTALSRLAEGGTLGYALGGATDSIHALRGSLEAASDAPIIDLRGVGVESSDAAIHEACMNAGHGLVEQTQAGLVETCFEASAGGGLGPERVERALATSAAHTLLLADSAVAQSPGWANDLLARALMDGATVEILRGAPSERMAREAEGVGVLLRFPPP